MRRLVLATLLFSAVGVADASACNVTRFQFFFGSDTSSTMQVSSGRRCSLVLSTGARSTFSSISVSAPARNGTARPDGASKVVYQSRPGFKGSDSFGVRVSGSSRRGTGTSTLTVAVMVQ